MLFTTTKIARGRFWELLTEMTKKELKARYKNTYFGFLWIFVNPILQMFVIGFVFQFIIGEPIENYYVYLLVGLLIWNYFSGSINKVTSSIINERSLIKKANFPREVIPLSIMLSNYINLLISFVLVFIPVSYLGTLSFSQVPGLLLAFALLLSFTIGLGFFTSAMNVRYRDVAFFVQAALMLWFYATPIVYSVGIMPERLTWLWKINPLTVVVQLSQSALVSGTKPGVDVLMSNIIIILFTLFLGIKVFRSQSNYFDDWV